MKQNLSNFSLSVPQKLQLYQVVAYLESNDTARAIERVREILSLAKEPGAVTLGPDWLFTGYSVGEIAEAAAGVLSEKKNMEAA